MTAKRIIQPIDRVATIIIVLLALVIGLLVWGEKTCGTECWFHTGARVSQFSWQNKVISGEDRAFLVEFNRPMDRGSVEENLVIEPPLPGKISWSGLRLAYTLETPAPYGETYRVSLSKAKERFAAGDRIGEVMQPFVGEFHTRDRLFAYVGSEGEENGRLILFDQAQQQKTILTPDDLIVFDFEAYPGRDRFLFSAATKASGVDGIRTLQLYTVTTGLNEDSTDFKPQIELVLDNQQYQNNQFDLSQDGKKIVVQRINRDNPADFGLWTIVEHQQPQPLPNSSGGDFVITPDSQAVAVAKGEGIALLPLQTDAEPIDFLPEFGQVLSFSADGSSAAMINYNTDNAELRYTQSLFYVNNRGIQRELLNIEGSIIDCKFNPTATDLYCLLTELETGEEYRELPYLAKIEIKSSEMTTLLRLSQYQDGEISIAPDGIGILFDRLLDDGNVDAVTQTKRLWLLNPTADSTNYDVEPLPFIGFHPQWLP